MAFRVGIDLVEVASVSEALAAHGDHYLERVYTEREVADCRSPAGIAPERLAARFAAKEATLKVLRAGDAGMSLRAIEILRDPAGWVDLELSGPAAAIAAEAGLSGFTVSLTHDGGYASAVVLAELSKPADR